MTTLKASQRGLAKVKQTRKDKGWAVYDFRWLEEASLVLGISWEEKGVLASGISESTWKRFLAGRHPINAEAFKAYCQVLGLNWNDIVEQRDRKDWGKAPDVSIFYGRTSELTTLEQWIVGDNCRLVEIFGMGGMGKTSLAAKLAQRIQHEFEFIIWRSLLHAPPVEEILAELIQFLCERQETDLPNNLDSQILRLLKYLRSHRCLLILDNAEAILQSGNSQENHFTSCTGVYQNGYEGYGQLFKCVGETLHKSCLVLTSGEKLQGLAELEGETLPVRSLHLKGLPEAEGRNLFSAKGSFTGSDKEWRAVISHYAGNPLALKLVASAIRDYFGGSISCFLEFLKRDSFIFDDIRALLEQQFRRLSHLEQEVMSWLAVNQEPMSFEELQRDLNSHLSSGQLLQVLAALQRRSMIEFNADRFTQKPVIREYIITQLRNRVCEEIKEVKIMECPRLSVPTALQAHTNGI